MKKLFAIFLSFLSLTTFAQADNFMRRITYELGKIEESLPQINILIKSGEKVQAKELVETTLQEIEQIEIYQKDAMLSDGGATEEDLLIPQTQEIKRFLIIKANKLKNAIGIFVHCDAKIFDQEYNKIKDKIQGDLAGRGYSFLDEAEQADWIIEITSSAREGNKLVTGGFATYFSYVDLQLLIIKATTQKKIYQNVFSEKGGDSRSYEAAAREAYKEIMHQVSEIIKEQLEKQ